jgi:hypothetical protein
LPAQPSALLESHERIEAIIEQDDSIELMELIAQIALEESDHRFAENCCARLAKHRNAIVRGNAVLGFGHLARRFGQLDRRRVHRLVDIALHDHSDYVRAHAESAAEDLTTFLSWEFCLPDR